jgi:hypothetical protein
MRSIHIVSITVTVTLTLTLVAFAAPASAQEVTRMPEGAHHAVGVDGGLESAFVARATYAHRIGLGLLKDERLFARFTLPFITPDVGEWSIEAGIRATPVSWRDLRLAILLGPVVRNSDNDLYTATGIGVGATALFGYEGTRWGLSGEVGYEQLLTSYLRHSALYRDTYYADAKDGWYALTGSTARGGLRGGVRIGSVEIAARAGVEATGRLHATNPPFYATLGSAYAF